MKRLVVGIVLLSSITAYSKEFVDVDSFDPVYGNDCSIYIDMKVNFEEETDLNTFGGAGSVEELEDISNIQNLVQSRGYTIIGNKDAAEFVLETSNGVQCVMLADDASDFDYNLSALFGTDYYLAGRFSGHGIENSFHKTINGIFKVTKFKNQIKKILNYCKKETPSIECTEDGKYCVGLTKVKILDESEPNPSGFVAGIKNYENGTLSILQYNENERQWASRPVEVNVAKILITGP